MMDHLKRPSLSLKLEELVSMASMANPNDYPAFTFFTECRVLQPSGCRQEITCQCFKISLCFLVIAKSTNNVF